MPEWVEPHSEPLSKLALLDSRLARLRGAVKAGESSAQIRKAAEKVRGAHLSVIKAKRALIREYPQRDPGGRRSSHLLAEQSRWQSISTEAIIEDFGQADA